MGARWLAAVLSALLLAACTTTTTRVTREEPAPAQRALTAPPPATAMHRVQPGDTLYGIAFRNNVDWRAVAAWNGIAEPFVIRPGQLLRLTPPEGERPRVAATRAASPAAEATATPTERPASPPPPMPRGPLGSPAPATAVTAPPAPPAVGAGTPAATPGGAEFRPGQWLWPTEGQVVARFTEGDRSRQGIAIAGTAGQAVRAAAAGTVVYSGAGLVGFGELIIIKHDDQWLSAYGHNRRRLVAEGATVQAGQQIAELGRTGTSRDMLHFEIRRSGRPVDPLPLLPRR